MREWKNEIVTRAEETTNSDIPAFDRYDESYTWTFYVLASKDHYIVLRWYGCSNGYYSESVSFYQEE